MSFDQKFCLKSEEREWLDESRQWLKGHFTESSDEKYASIDGKLRLIATILEQGWIEQGETWKLQSLGIALGDALAQKLMLDWVTIDDEFGRQPALNWPGTSILAFPLTMISKRIEWGEVINVRDMFEQVVKSINEMGFSGRHI